MDFCLWQFKAFWLYAAVEPLTGEHFIRQFSHVDTDCYQQFLNQFSQAYPDSLNILQVDNGRFHKAKRLQIPENIILLFQPPHCPELNPSERLWLYLKRDLRWSLFEDLTQLQTKVDQLKRGINNRSRCFHYWLPLHLGSSICRQHYLNWYKI